MDNSPQSTQTRPLDTCVDTYSDPDSSGPEITPSDQIKRSRSSARASDWADSSDDEAIIPGSRTHNSSVEVTAGSGLLTSLDRQYQDASAISESQNEDIDYISSMPDQADDSTRLSASTPMNSMTPESSSQKRDRSMSPAKEPVNTTMTGRRTRSATIGLKKIDTPSQQSRVSQTGPVSGPSTTKGAIDSRQRIAAERDYKRQIRTLIDNDIMNQVEAEGGITPDGRLFKAATRMFKRSKKERDDNAQVTVESNGEQRVKELKEENKLLREKLEKAKEILTFT